jgi:hypothetical protein
MIFAQHTVGHVLNENNGERRLRGVPIILMHNVTARAVHLRSHFFSVALNVTRARLTDVSK